MFMEELSALLASWTFTATEPTRSIVLPDGCRDLILRKNVVNDMRWFVADLATSAYAVESDPGSSFSGYRFHPGAVINEAALLRAIHSKCNLDDADVSNAINDYVRLDERVLSALASLSSRSNVAAAASAEGVCERTLERLMRVQTGHTPSYWKNLARVRRAGRSLTYSALANPSNALSLAQLAADHHFTDQAHMTHEFRRWFGVTPAQCRASPTLLRSVADAGYF
jgi:AraC-like DNA-binding protein